MFPVWLTESARPAGGVTVGVMNSRKPPAVVVAYQPQWPQQFAVIRAAVDVALADVSHDTDHVGSTAVPGLPAKPIIDVDVVVPAADVVPVAVARLAAAGWVPEGDLGVTGREAFEPRDDLPYHHLYVVVSGSLPYRDHIDLRDLLRARPDRAAQYAALKRQLEPLLGTDREAYVAGKADLITDLLREARGTGE
jgi:GrpB-like predicted nucleotidyltransferase (UPF0157 family)